MESKVDALVLRTANYGEADKMITLFSLQKGKISAAAKGVRKAKAKLAFAAQPFCFAEYVLASRGERNTVVSAAATDGFYALREDIGKFYAAACVTGLCDALLLDGIVNEELFLRAVSALREMCEGDEAAALIGFFLHALALSGYEVQLSACAGCGAVLEGRCWFDAADGCFYCADCARGAGVSAVTVRTLQGCAAGETEPFPPEGKARAVKLLYAYLREKTGAAVKAVDEYLALLGAP